MKKITSCALALLIAGCIAGVSVNASAEVGAPAPAAAGSTFDQRLAQRKAEQAITLDQLDQTRLVSKCTGAQVRLRAMQVKQVPQLAERLRVYKQIDAKVLVVIGELKLANKDTFELEKQRLELVSQTNEYQVTSTAFSQTIDDLLIINCKADTTGFKALVETIRAYYADLQTQTAGIHELVVNTIKPEIAAQSDALQPKTATDKDNN